MLHMLERERGLTQKLFASSLGTGSIIPSPAGSTGGNVRELDDSWPMMLVAVSMTKHSIDALRSGLLTKDVVKAQSALEISHEFHHACFFCFSR